MSCLFALAALALAWSAAPAAAQWASSTQGRSAPASCMFATRRPPVPVDTLTTDADPAVGPATADIVLVEFFDPNCPACRSAYPVVKALAAEYPERLRVVYKPMPLWDKSIPQVQALMLAAAAGRFVEMMEFQYAFQLQHGYSPLNVRYAAAAIGMHGDSLVARINRGAFREAALENRALFQSLRLPGTPSIFINGRFVPGPSMSPSCLKELVERAAGKAAE